MVVLIYNFISSILNEIAYKLNIYFVNNRYYKMAQRFNSGKLRYDLVPVHAQEEYVSVLTAGAAKYGDSNWRLGLDWMSVMASLERHLMAWKKGEDLDPETGLPHTAHIMCNAAFLAEYRHIHKDGDNRLPF